MDDLVIVHADARALAAIDHLEGECQAIRWEYAWLKSYLRRRNAFLRLIHARRSIEYEGYICYRRMVDSLEIERLGVLPKRRRQGLGTRLVKEAIDHGSKRGRRPRVVARVSDHADLAVHLFFRACGFKAHIARASSHARDDVYVFQFTGG